MCCNPHLLVKVQAAVAREPQAATCFQPNVPRPVRQLHHVYRPGTSLSNDDASVCVSGHCSPQRQMVSHSSGSSCRWCNDQQGFNIQAAAVNASKVKTAFAEAGLSQDAVDHVLRRYPPYLRWNVEDKLLPAIQSWQQELGASFLSEVERVPTLSCMKPAEELLKNQYLASIGIKSPERLRKTCPCAFGQSLTAIQSKVAFLQEWGFTTAQTLSLIEKHPNVLQCTSEHVGELLRLVEDMFDCVDREDLCDVMLHCKHVGLGTTSPATLHRNFTYFCTHVEVDHKQMKRAWRHGVFTVPPAQLEIRLSSAAAQLGVTIDQAKGLMRSMPTIATNLPETVGLHVTQLLGLGFSHGQVKSMCLQQPALLTYNYSSDVRVAK